MNGVQYSVSSSISRFKNRKLPFSVDREADSFPGREGLTRRVKTLRSWRFHDLSRDSIKYYNIINNTFYHTFAISSSVFSFSLFFFTFFSFSVVTFFRNTILLYRMHSFDMETVLSLYKFSKILYILLTLHRFRIANCVCSCVLQSVSIERLLLDTCTYFISIARNKRTRSKRDAMIASVHQEYRIC